MARKWLCTYFHAGPIHNLWRRQSGFPVPLTATLAERRCSHQEPLARIAFPEGGRHPHADGHADREPNADVVGCGSNSDPGTYPRGQWHPPFEIILRHCWPPYRHCGTCGQILLLARQVLVIIRPGSMPGATHHLLDDRVHQRGDHF